MIPWSLFIYVMRQICPRFRPFLTKFSVVGGQEKFLQIAMVHVCSMLGSLLWDYVPVQTRMCSPG